MQNIMLGITLGDKAKWLVSTSFIIPSICILIYSIFELIIPLNIFVTA